MYMYIYIYICICGMSTWYIQSNPLTPTDPQPFGVSLSAVTATGLSVSEPHRPDLA